MLSPSSAAISRLVSDVLNGCNLHLICKRWRTLNGKPVADIYANMPLKPYCLAYFDVRKVCRYSAALFYHCVRANVWYSVTCVCSAAICCACVSIPAPEHALNKTHAVKAESISARRLNHRCTRCLLIIIVVIAISLLVCICHRCAKATHNIKCLMVYCNVL